MTPQQLIAKLEEFFRDKSRRPSETREGLKEAAEHALILAESLPADECDK